MKRLLTAAIVMATAASTAAAAEFVVKPGGDNKVVFVSKATMETFEGKTKNLSGTIVVDPAAIGDSMSVHLEVDLTTLDTGIAKRNQHMRDHHLETSKYPKAIFDGAAVTGAQGAKLEPGKATTFDCEGTFSLHGVSRRLHIPVEATYTPKGAGGKIVFSTRFPVGLADYNIDLPQFLFMKLADTQDVHVNGVAVASP